ncbi:unnamed protein product [Gulo gulo]|uniref:Uncharacterized protein n=1 Tax=Gulo gulo TaxID=48420 RepID=A0A9X9LI37_GULGU|nr:unnamed protein product [Gulo gulo]
MPAGRGAQNLQINEFDAISAVLKKNHKNETKQNSGR